MRRGALVTGPHLATQRRHDAAKVRVLAHMCHRNRSWEACREAATALWPHDPERADYAAFWARNG